MESVVSNAAPPKHSRFAALAAQSSSVIKLSEIQAQDHPRFSSGVPEFDRVLGGGMVPGMVVLLGGDPGIGKSTLLLQSMVTLAKTTSALYVSGEESAGQIALRAQRLGLEHTNLNVLTEIQLEQIVAQLETHKPQVLVIDSIQTLYTSELSAAPGSVSQVRECASQLTRLAKAMGITTILVGHVTKEGTLAGPRVLEHIVDTVLYFEGDSQSSFRLVRAFKNRFGAVNELGVFAMTDRGLKGVNNPSALFLSQTAEWVAGSCVMCTQEGARPLLVEIQALVDSSHSPSPRRLSVGLEQNRLAMLLADVPGKWQELFLAPGPWPPEFLKAMRESYLRAGPDFQISSMQPRPIDLGPIHTLTTLNKRPYLRMMVVWLMLLAVAVKVWFLTH